ncbi:MAG TPA: hypothetical protein VND89_08800 [Acidimicrobiales bacterium]|nr:hypothetical protein [Acidimicrobiales bacterium]
MKWTPTLGLTGFLRGERWLIASSGAPLGWSPQRPTRRALEPYDDAIDEWVATRARPR